MPTTTVTMTADMIVPEVMTDMVNEKIEAELKHIKYAKVDNTLQGKPGDTVKVPCWKYSGDARDVEEGEEATVDTLETDESEFTIKTATKSIGVTQESVNAGKGNPLQAAMRQVAKGLAGKMNQDTVDSVYGASRVITPKSGTLAPIGYGGIVGAVVQYDDESDDVEKVMFINPLQEGDLLVDPLFMDKSKFGGNVAVRGAIGKIAGCWVKKSKKIRLINCEASTSGTSGAVKITMANKADYWMYDATNKKVVSPAIDTYVKALDVPYYLNQFIKLEEDSEETEDSTPAVTIYMKKKSSVDHEWLPRVRKHFFTGTNYYGSALTNDEKVLLAKFAAS